MTKRENWLRAARFQNPEWIPGTVGAREDGWHRHGRRLNDLYEKYTGGRAMPDEIIPRPDPKYLAGGEYHAVTTDEWGVGMEGRIFGIHPMIVGHPLADWKALADYHTPPHASMDPAELAAERERVAAAKATDEWVVIQGGHRTFERLQWLRGYENLMLDFATGSPELERLADMIVEHSLSYVRRSIAVGADGVGFSDDWGTQNALMINPKTWREFFKPRYRRMFEPAKAAGMLVTFHSDGHLLEVLDDFREVGVDVLNPQTNCQDMEELGRRARARRLCISADIDRQGVMSFGSPADVKAYFHRLAKTVGGPEGGLMFSCETGSETPFENIEAAFQVVQEYRERKGAAA